MTRIRVELGDKRKAGVSAVGQGGGGSRKRCDPRHPHSLCEQSVNDFDRLGEELQRRVSEQERALYSRAVIEHAHNPENLGRLVAPDHLAVVKGWCGDTMEIYLRLGRGNRIREATFMTDGCGPSVACGSMLTRMVRGLSPEKALQISAQQLAGALHGLPEDSLHCAELAVKTLRAALRKV
jgi:nitrogen fixation NifU-like protein